MNTSKMATVFGACVIAVSVVTVWTSIARADQNNDGTMMLDGKRVRPVLVCPGDERLTLPDGSHVGPRPSDSTEGGHVVECRVVYQQVSAGASK
jgi:hypothetical protein